MKMLLVLMTIEFVALFSKPTQRRLENDPRGYARDTFLEHLLVHGRYLSKYHNGEV